MNDVSESLIKILSALGILRASTGLIEKFSHIGFISFLNNQILKYSKRIPHKCIIVSGIIEEIGTLRNDRSYSTSSVHLNRTSEDLRTEVGIARSKTVGEDDFSVTYIKVDGQRFTNIQFLNISMWEAIEVGDKIQALIYIDGKGPDAVQDRDTLTKFKNDFTQGLLNITHGSKWMFLRNYTRDVQVEYPTIWMSGPYYDKVGYIGIICFAVFLIPAIALMSTVILFIIGVPIAVLGLICSLALVNNYHKDMVDNIKIYHSIIDQTDN